MDIKDFKSKIFDTAKEYGFDDYEIYYEKGGSFQVRIFNGEISEYKNSSPAGVSFRGTYKGKMGYAYSERIDESVIQGIVVNAAANALVIEDDEIERLYPGDDEYPSINDEDISDISIEDKIKLALDMEKLTYNADARVKSVDYCGLGSGKGEVYIANSLGLELSHTSNTSYAYVYPRVEENSCVKLAGDSWLGRSVKDFNYSNLVDKAVKRALSYLHAESVESGVYPVIFDNLMAISIFSAFINVFYAERVQKGFSLLKGKLGEKIASDIVNIRDDGIYSLCIDNCPFDSEGVSVKNKAVIENGILKTLLYNLKSAEKDGVKSTGNGFKASYKSPVDTSCTNFYIEPSKTSPEELAGGLKKGILITELQGLHSGTNAISGDFSCSADGFLIENGAITRPVEQITVAGNFFEMLKSITGIGNDLRFEEPSNHGNIGMPSILISELKISGEKKAD